MTLMRFSFSGEEEPKGDDFYLYITNKFINENVKKKTSRSHQSNAQIAGQIHEQAEALRLGCF